MKEEFIRLALHRGKINQHKAHKLWEQIKKEVDPKMIHVVTVEWSHYTSGELTTEEFGKTLKEALFK